MKWLILCLAQVEDFEPIAEVVCNTYAMTSACEILQMVKDTYM